MIPEGVTWTKNVVKETEAFIGAVDLGSAGAVEVSCSTPIAMNGEIELHTAALHPEATTTTRRRRVGVGCVILQPKLEHRRLSLLHAIWIFCVDLRVYRRAEEGQGSRCYRGGK